MGRPASRAAPRWAAATLPLLAACQAATPLDEMGPVDGTFAFSRGLTDEPWQLQLVAREGCPRFTGEARLGGVAMDVEDPGGTVPGARWGEGVVALCDPPTFTSPPVDAATALEIVVSDDSARWSFSDARGLTTGYATAATTTPPGGEISFDWTGSTPPQSATVSWSVNGDPVDFGVYTAETARLTVTVPRDAAGLFSVDIETSLAFTLDRCEGFATCGVVGATRETHTFPVE